MTGVLVGNGQYANTTQTQTAQICFYAPSPFFTQNFCMDWILTKIVQTIPSKEKKQQWDCLANADHIKVSSLITAALT